MAKLASSSILLALLTLVTSASGQILKLSPLTTFGTNGDGSIRPGERDYLDGASQIQRGMAWNPVTGHIIVVCRTNAASVNVERILILDGATGADIGTLDLSSLTFGGNASFFVNLIGIADDGAIYVGNVSNAQIPAQYRLYRWDNEAAEQTLVWFGDPANGVAPSVNRRWGDTMTVRGAGLTTEVLIASRGTNVCIFRPADISMVNFNPTYISTDTPVGALGYGLTFGAGDTFWGTAGASSGGPLYHLSFDLNTGVATTIQTFYSTNFSGTVSPITFLPGSNVLAGIETRPGADFVKLYDLAQLPASSALQDWTIWVTNNNNNNFAGSLAFTTNVPPILYALDSDNGLMAFTIGNVSSNTLPPSISLQPASRTTTIGSNVVFTAVADGEPPLSYQWQYKSTTNSATNVFLPGATGLSLTLTAVQISNSGSYTFIATNLYGAATSSVAALTVVSASQAFYEPFAYTVGTLLANQGPDPTRIWNPVTGAGGAISNTSLSYPGLPASTGKAFAWGGSTVSERLPTGTNLSGPLFFSFLFRVDSIAGSYTSDTIAGFGEATNSADTVFDPKINIASNSPGVYQLGVYKGGGTTLGALAPNLFVPGDVVFVVGNYNFINDDLNDTVNMWINPAPSTFGAATPPPPTVGPIGATSGTDMKQLSCFFWRSTMGSVRKVADELRVGYTWADVTPLAPPTLSVTQSGTNVLVMWPSYYADTYSLQGTTNLTGGAWASVANPVAVSGANNVVTNSATRSARFFRLIK